MKKLTNKKGFTLIEMLVVIAIIAVLVAIIIPVVTNSTVKAAAAANAANMRSFKSEITTLFLQEQGIEDDDKNIIVGTDNAVSFPTDTNVKYPAMKSISGHDEVKDTDAAKATTPTASSDWGITYANNQFTVTYCGHPIDWYATIAEKGAAD